jgi:REP element-mobilizing transposase RayT
MPYHQLFYHMVWATKDRQPLLTADVEPTVHELLRTKAIGLGATVFALNGMADHVHLVVSVPPTIALSKFIGQVKGATSTRFNKGGYRIKLFWQEEYGVFTFDGKRLPNYIGYVQRQKEHHAEGKLFTALERTTGQDAALLFVREETVIYAAEEESWQRDMAELSAHGAESPDTPESRREVDKPL